MKKKQNVAKREPMEELLNREQIRKITGVSDTTLGRWIELGSFPRPIRKPMPGRKGRNFWRRSQVEAWIRERSRID